MKANEAPERIYFSGQQHWSNPFIGLMQKCADTDIEYTRTDAFIDKACEWLKEYRQDTPDGIGYIAGIVNDKTIEDFRNAMKGG